MWKNICSILVKNFLSICHKRKRKSILKIRIFNYRNERNQGYQSNLCEDRKSQEQIKLLIALIQKDPSFDQMDICRFLDQICIKLLLQGFDQENKMFLLQQIITIRPNQKMISSIQQHNIQIQNNANQGRIQVTSTNDNQKKSVKIYLRKVNKKTVIVNVKSPAALQQLFQVIQTNIGIPKAELVLFWKGKKIQSSQINPQLFDFCQNDIIHIHHLKSPHKNTLNLTIKTFDCPGAQNRSLKIEVLPHERIYETLKKNIQNLEGLVLIESGRKLDWNKTFQEELIENDSTIILTVFKEETSKSKSKLATKSTQESQTAFESKQNINLEVNKPIVKKTTSWSFSQESQICSFKKKQKPSAYISASKSNGNEIIWQSDKNSHDSSRPKEIKKLAKKRYSQVQRMEPQISCEEKFEMIIFSDEEDSPIFEIKQTKTKFTQQQQTNCQIDQLFSKVSHLQENSIVKKYIEPPHIISNIDFLEQEDQLQMGEINDQNEKQGQQKSVIKTIANLGASIGKLRGVFIPVIPTEDVEIFDNQQDF